MNRPFPLHSLQRVFSAPRAGVLAASLAMLVNAAACIPAHAQQGDLIEQKRLQAPIGHRQPRPRDLPPSVVQDENMPGAKAGFDTGRDINICRGC
jgi:hypothetical protein